MPAGKKNNKKLLNPDFLMPPEGQQTVYKTKKQRDVDEGDSDSSSANVQRSSSSFVR